MRRVPSTRITTIAAVARNWIRVIRVISKSVPSKRMAGGKNSPMDGGWNSASAAFAIRVAA